MIVLTALVELSKHQQRMTLYAILLMEEKSEKILPMMLISTDADRVPMLLVASHTYVPCMSYVSGPLKMRTLSLISALLGIEPLILIKKYNFFLNPHNKLNPRHNVNNN